VQVFVVALHILACTVLIGSILLQPGKGGDPVSAFGGGIASTMFGPRGPANVLTRATTVIAFLFMFTSISLSLYSNKSVIAGSDVNSQLQRLQKDKNKSKEDTIKPDPDAPKDTDAGSTPPSAPSPGSTPDMPAPTP
jgi:preprotein translocase subunit SecG